MLSDTRHNSNRKCPKQGLLKTKGQFGFAINGKAEIREVKLMKTKGENSLPPKDFKGKPRINPFLSLNNINSYRYLFTEFPPMDTAKKIPDSSENQQRQIKDRYQQLVESPDKGRFKRAVTREKQIGLYPYKFIKHRQIK